MVQFADYLLLVSLIVCLSLPVSESISCYQHGVCTPTTDCVKDTNKVTCTNSETFCLKVDLLFDAAERRCADSMICNGSIPVPQRYCCQTDYCNQSVSTFSNIYSTLIFVSVLLLGTFHFLH